MKKFIAVLTVLGLVVCAKVFADESTSANAGSSITPTPSGSSTSTSRQHKKKKTTIQATPQVTPSPTVVPTAALKPVLTPTPAITSQEKSGPTSSEFSSNLQVYDRVGASGELRQAVSLASTTLGSSLLKHDKSVFLWLGKITNGDNRQSTYIRLSLNGVELGGPRNPWLVLTGTVYDQSGSESKVGDAIEVAVDFRDVKVDYEGTKLGEVQKGNDISDQFFELLNGHSNYQWVVLAQDRIRDEKNLSAVPAYLVQAKEGYAFLESLKLSRERSAANTPEH
jgi:hypothetical protein